MAYAAVTSLMETLYLHFLQSQPRLPIEDLEAQIRDGNENLGLLQQIVEAEMREMELDEEASSKRLRIKACFPRLHGIFNNEAIKQTDYYPKKKKLIKSEKLLQLADLEAQIRDANENLGLLQQIVEAEMREMELDEKVSSKCVRIKACFPRLYGKQQAARDSTLLTSRLREVAEVKQKIVSLHENLGLLQQSLEKSEIPYDDARVRVMKDLEAQIRDASFELEERIEMELSTIYLAKDNLHIAACLLRLHQNFNEAEKQTEYQIREGNENLGLLQQIVEAQIREMDEASSSKRPPRFYGKQQLARLREVGEVKQKTMVSLHENLGLLQQIVEAQIRVMESDEEASSSERLRIEACHPKLYGKVARRVMELDEEVSSSKRLHIKACHPRLYGNQQLARLREVGEVKQKMMVSLHENLGLLQDILQIYKIGNDDAGAMKDLEAAIRYVWFNAEERIEMELTAIYLAKDSLLHITACLLRLHEIFIEAEKQTDYHRNKLIRLAKVSLLGRIRRRGLLQLVKGSSLHDLVHKKIIVSNVSKNVDGRMVGCDKLFEKILDQMLTQQTTKGRQVVSIVGMGGIGKTTLAHKVYEHPSIASYFDMRAWVTVSQEYNVEQMLRCLIGCVTAASRDELHKQSTDQDQLAERLRKHLKEQRYLIVMDDIWSTTAWDSVQRCFPDDNNGSCILLTSRLKKVGEYASSGNSPLNMPFLDADESWNLFCKVFGKTEFLLVFEEIGRDIVKKCNGLPLAITIVASLLSKTEEEEKWKNVAKSVMGDSSDACSRILYVSYNQLPHHLKACFLYFGIFEEDYEISVKKLVRLWAAEGFLSTMKHVNLEKVAMECLQDLVDRSLIIVSKHSYNGEMKRLRIHDLLRDLCLREARLENLLNVNGVKKHCRWISHTSRSFYNEVMFEDEGFHKPHSFHYFWNADVKRLFSHFKLLRVLDMSNRFWDDGVVGLNVLANLVHLRYFALYSIGTFDAKLFEHWNNMQTLISWDDFILYSSEPSGIWKMPLLRNLCIGRICSLETPSVVYRNLENISWLDSKLCTKDLFTMIPNLKTLGVDGGYCVISLDCFYNFVHLEQLEKLSIRMWNLVMCSIPWATSLPNLKKLSFLESNLQWSELSSISMLPNLEILKLIDACKGPEWETSDGGFHRLKRLVIKKTNFRCWNAVGDHFPMLECLEISECYGLKEIPSGFADITTLALIQLSKCSDSLVASAKWIQEEQNSNYGNDALLVRY